jgi:hypothetical protein
MIHVSDFTTIGTKERLQETKDFRQQKYFLIMKVRMSGALQSPFL